MSAHLRALRLVNFRNHADDTVLLSPGLNIVVGDNAQWMKENADISRAQAQTVAKNPAAPNSSRRTLTARRNVRKMLSQGQTSVQATLRIVPLSFPSMAEPPPRKCPKYPAPGIIRCVPIHARRFRPAGR